MRAPSATLRTNIGVPPLPDAQRSHWRSSGSVFAEQIMLLGGVGLIVNQPLGYAFDMTAVW